LLGSNFRRLEGEVYVEVSVKDLDVRHRVTAAVGLGPRDRHSGVIIGHSIEMDCAESFAVEDCVIFREAHPGEARM